MDSEFWNVKPERLDELQKHFEVLKEKYCDKLIAAGEYDSLEYEKYEDALRSGLVSVDGLSRIIKHDGAHSWKDSVPLARKKALQDALTGVIDAKKMLDERGDQLYGNSWPLPLVFSKIN